MGEIGLPFDRHIFIAAPSKFADLWFGEPSSKWRKGMTNTEHGYYYEMNIFTKWGFVPEAEKVAPLKLYNEIFWRFTFFFLFLSSSHYTTQIITFAKKDCLGSEDPITVIP